MTIRCSAHPNGSIDLPETAFYASDRNHKVAICKECRKRKAKQRAAAARQLRRAVIVPINDVALETPPIDTPETQPRNVQATSDGSMQKIGGYYISANAVLIADVTQAGRVVVHTSLLEIDRETKHPRNKRLLFTQVNDPIEYKAMLTWLDQLAGVPIELITNANELAALQLAEEMQTKLTAANQRIAELEAAIAPLRSLLNGKI